MLPPCEISSCSSEEIANQPLPFFIQTLNRQGLTHHRLLLGRESPDVLLT